MTKTTEENLSQSKYADHRNVTKGYIGRLVKEGRLHLIKGKLNVLMSDAELDNKSNNDKAPNYWSEKALHEKAKRELAELDLKLKSNHVVEVDQIGDHLDKIFSAVRQRLLAMPRKIAPLVQVDKKTNVRFFMVGTDTAKEMVFSRLQIEDVGEGYCHYPMHYDEEYFAMLTVEHCVTRFHKGVARREWVLKKGQRRNEALDIFVYNFVEDFKS